MSWIARETHTLLEDKYVDVFPDGEQLLHLLGNAAQCGCGPKLTKFPNGTAMCTHNSWDNREEVEESIAWV